MRQVPAPRQHCPLLAVQAWQACMRRKDHHGGITCAWMRLKLLVVRQGMHYSRGRRLYATLSGRGFAEPARSPMLDEAA